MKVVVDDKIPYIREALGKITSDTVYIRGADISAADLKDADALIVRTRTRCDENLLAGTNVRFVATATIGIDHLDTEWLNKAGIRWVNCPGCNAGSVAQYMLSAMVRLSHDRGFQPEGKTAGIVGCGHVGSKVKEVFEHLGMRVLINDPPSGMPESVGLGLIEKEADIISFHVPLTYKGLYPTYHLADRHFFNNLSGKGTYIVNTSRGGVVDEEAMLDAMNDGRVAGAIIDTWEDEPNINVNLLAKAYIATPHIAGYSADGKVAADNMVIKELCDFFGVENPGIIMPPPLPEGLPKSGNPLELYDPMTDTIRLRENPEAFEDIRGNYPLRRERARLV